MTKPTPTSIRAYNALAGKAVKSVIADIRELCKYHEGDFALHYSEDAFTSDPFGTRVPKLAVCVFGKPVEEGALRLPVAFPVIVLLGNGTERAGERFQYRLQKDEHTSDFAIRVFAAAVDLMRPEVNAARRRHESASGRASAWDIIKALKLKYSELDDNPRISLSPGNAAFGSVAVTFNVDSLEDFESLYASWLEKLAEKYT